MEKEELDKRRRKVIRGERWDKDEVDKRRRRRVMRGEKWGKGGVG